MKQRLLVLIGCVALFLGYASPSSAEFEPAHECNYFLLSCLHSGTGCYVEEDIGDTGCVIFNYAGTCYDREKWSEASCGLGETVGACHGIFYCEFDNQGRRNIQTFSLPCGSPSDPAAFVVADANHAICGTLGGESWSCDCTKGPDGKPTGDAATCVKH